MKRTQAHLLSWWVGCLASASVLLGADGCFVDKLVSLGEDDAGIAGWNQSGLAGRNQGGFAGWNQSGPSCTSGCAGSTRGAGGSTQSYGKGGGAAVEAKCPAQEAKGDNLCKNVLGYAWDGLGCSTVVGCNCEGAGCSWLFASYDDCKYKFSGCLNPVSGAGGTTNTGSTCPAQEAKGDNVCKKILGYAWDGLGCSTVVGCNCEGAGCGWLFASYDDCKYKFSGCSNPVSGAGGTTNTGSVCTAQEAKGDAACEKVLGYAWDGAVCNPIVGCSCHGADCDALFDSYTPCKSAYTSCPMPPPTAPTHDPCRLQEAKGYQACEGKIVGYAWTVDGCQPISGCSCSGPDCAALYLTLEECTNWNAKCVCSVGADWTCNDNPAISSIRGQCLKDGSCACDPNGTMNPKTGRCL